jgi:cytochrome c55X
LILTYVFLSQIAFVPAAEPPMRIDSDRRDELIHMLRHDCGSCHGMTLKGGLGPALTPEAMAARPVEYLYLTVRDGHPGTPMPPWHGILTDAEIHWLVSQLRSGIPSPW